MLTLQQVVENFEYLDDWDERYQYLVELGESLPPLEQEFYTDDNRVKPCMSSVWVVARRSIENHDLIEFAGDCDTSIIKGVLALLIELMSGRTVDEIKKMDMDVLFDELKLAENLSPNRHVGIYAIVNMMKAKANELACEGVLD